jgi:hypothetical protein
MENIAMILISLGILKRQIGKAPFLWCVLLLMVALPKSAAVGFQTAPEKDTRGMAGVAEKLLHGTNVERQHIMLDLCITLEVERKPPMVETLVRAVIPLIEDSHSTTRSLAVELLRRVGKESRPAIPALVRVLGDREGCAGLLAVPALANLGEASVLPLTEALNEKNIIARQLAATALGRIGRKAKEALPALKKAMDAEKHDIVRERLDTAIKKISADD